MLIRSRAKWKKLVTIPLMSLMLIGSIAPATSSSAGLITIATIQGEVLLKRRFWLGYRLANVGEALVPDDRLRVQPGASTRILCSNLTKWYPPTGDSQVSAGCNEIGVLRRPGDSTAPTRGPSQNAPYLISPRNTAVLPGQSIQFTWNAIPEATSYEISIKQLSRVIWTTTVTEPVATFPDWAELRRNHDYIINITASTGATEPEGTGIAPTIRILSDEKAEEIETYRAQIMAAGMDAEAQALALAYLYQSYELHQLAIETLAKQIGADSEMIAVFTLQAQLYQQTGLGQFAQVRYEAALELAEVSGDEVQQAVIQEQLGQLAQQVGDWETALAHLTEADRLYRQFLDRNHPDAQEKLTTLAAEINRIQNRLSGTSSETL